MLDSSGHLIQKGPSSLSNGSSAIDPTGGLVMQRYDGSRATWIDAIDAAGNVRWTHNIACPANTPFALGVDRQGNVLTLWLSSGSWTSGAWSGQWFAHDGTAGAVFAAGNVPTSELVPRAGSGLFLKSGSSWIGQVDALAASVSAPPLWLRANTSVHVVHGGAGYAVLPDPADAAACEQRVDIVSPSGRVCGSQTFSMSSNACRTSTIRVGYDGTVVQQLSPNLEAPCKGAGYICNCTYRFWPGFFR